MDKLPLLGITRTRIVRRLADGPCTAVELAGSLGIQVSAARKHLERLQTMGMVDHRFERAGPGRPKKFYALTEGGRELFPQRYDEVLNAVLTDLVRDQGAARAERSLHRVAAGFARSTVPDPGTDRAHVQRLASGLEAFGFDPAISERGGECTITSRNCPILKTAKVHRELVCRGLHAEIIRAATGAEKVHRGTWIVDGAPSCTHTFRKA